MPSLEDLRAQALRLPVRERMKLADALNHSFDDSQEIEEAWKAEVERRLDEYEAGHVQLVEGDPISKLKQQLEARRRDEAQTG